MGNIIVEYEFVAEYERVVKCDDGSFVTTRMKIKKRGNEYFPVWMHEINNHSDSTSQRNVDDLLSYWDTQLKSAESINAFTINDDF
jgi:hypothetical protein